MKTLEEIKKEMKEGVDKIDEISNENLKLKLKKYIEDLENEIRGYLFKKRNNKGLNFFDLADYKELDNYIIKELRNAGYIVNDFSSEKYRDVNIVINIE